MHQTSFEVLVVLQRRAPSSLARLIQILHRQWLASYRILLAQYACVELTPLFPAGELEVLNSRIGHQIRQPPNSGSINVVSSPPDDHSAGEGRLTSSRLVCYPDNAVLP
mmetsp:Transcript_18281/g.38185  ORF Transcript_18281/g.38185 Transcript_18281/m.38185 type:complete len:109 (-) Transcript_18281:370-696(-)